MSIHFGVPIIAAAVMLAEAVASGPEGNWWERLINLGVAGVFLVWLMIRVEKILKENTRALHLNTIATTSVVLDSKHKDEALCQIAERCKEQAEAALRDESKTTLS